MHAEQCYIEKSWQGLQLKFKLLAFSKHFRSSTLFPKNSRTLESLLSGFPFQHNTPPRNQNDIYIFYQKTKSKRGYPFDTKQITLSLFSSEGCTLYGDSTELHCASSTHDFRLIAQFSCNCAIFLSLRAHAQARAHTQNSKIPYKLDIKISVRTAQNM